MKTFAPIKLASLTRPQVCSFKPRGGVWPDDELLKLGADDIKYVAWMIDPKTKTARVHRANGETEILRGDRMLTGNSVLPGFRFTLGWLFEPIGN